jgi:hypothetical protein
MEDISCAKAASMSKEGGTTCVDDSTVEVANETGGG